LSHAETPTAAPPAQSEYARCERCSSPVDESQRYCVVCGTRIRRGEDPVAQYLATATRRARAGHASRPDATRGRRRPGLGTAAVIAAIPLAVALGVIVGRASMGTDAKLNAAITAERSAVIAAERAQKALVASVLRGGTAASAQPVSATTALLASTFSLHQGFAVELQTVPVSGTGQAAVARAEQAATAKGATAIGVINQKSFSVSPKPSGNVYVLYSGALKTRSEANAALAKLKRRFPGAVVIAVRAITPSTSSAGAGGGSSLGAPATKAQAAQGANEVKQISHATGSNYVNAQNNLPGSVVVP